MYKEHHINEMRIFVIALASIVICCTSGELYSSTGHIEELAHEEHMLMRSLDEYIHAERERLNHLKVLAQKLANRSTSDTHQYDLSHPISQYQFLHRLKSREWEDVEHILQQDFSTSLRENLTEHKDHLPTDNDVNKTAAAIMRLQDTYQLDTHDLARGFVGSRKSRHEMSLQEVIDIGKVAYEGEDYYHCILWMEEAKLMEVYSKDEELKFEILDYLTFCLIQSGNMEQAYKLTNEMLKMKPNHENSQEKKNICEDALTTNTKGDPGDGKAVIDTFVEDGNVRESASYDGFDLYEKLCREGSEPIDPKIAKELKCFYWIHHDPWLTWQPVKIELLWKSPDIFRLYDVVSDAKIEEIMTLATPDLIRAKVDHHKKNTIVSDYRVSKTAWLYEDSIVTQLYGTIEAITGLHTNNAEQLQVCNYGVGGQYEPHLDANLKDGIYKKNNRIATWMFYFTDVEFGGSTVFLHPKIAVKPIKGSAVLWYNMLSPGKVDERTTHAGCPVAIGDKWVGNVWLHEDGQNYSTRITASTMLGDE